MPKRHVVWTDADIAFLREYYTILGPDKLAELMPARSSTSVQRKAKRLKLAPHETSHWTDAHVDFLTENYKAFGADYVAQHLGKSVSAVTNKASRMRLATESSASLRKALSIKHRWTEEQDELIREIYPLHGASGVVDEMRAKRTEHDIHNRAASLGVPNNYWEAGDHGEVARWSSDEIEVLEKNCSTMTVAELARRLPRRTERSIKHKLQQMRKQYPKRFPKRKAPKKPHVAPKTAVFKSPSRAAAKRRCDDVVCHIKRWLDEYKDLEPEIYVVPIVTEDYVYKLSRIESYGGKLKLKYGRCGLTLNVALGDTFRWQKGKRVLSFTERGEAGELILQDPIPIL